MSKLNIARILIAIGMIIGIKSLATTFGHIDEPLFTLPEEFGRGTTHAWHNSLHEAVGDIATIVVLLLVFFFAASFRG